MNKIERKGINYFNEFSRDFIPEIDRFINDFFSEKIKISPYSFMADMYKDLNEYCARDGKRIRPLLLLISYLGYKKGRKNLNEIIKLGAVIEMMHSFLLIQDDIIDRSVLRRGGKALHILCREKFSHLTGNKNIGSDTALILADVLFANSLEIIGNAEINLKVKNEFLKIFASTYEMTAWGQVLDVLHSLPKDINLKENISLRISSLKTAHYTIYYPMMMGYVLSGKGDKWEQKLIKDFSLPLGMAFQIKDDILGTFGKKENTGKPGDSDIIEGKMTLLITSALENLNESDRDKLIQLFSQSKKSKSSVKLIRAMIEKSGAFESTIREHNALIKRSVRMLEKLDISGDYKMILNNIIDSIKEINL